MIVYILVSLMSALEIISGVCYFLHDKVHVHEGKVFQNG